jgi:hypothetical protein
MTIESFLHWPRQSVLLCRVGSCLRSRASGPLAHAGSLTGRAPAIDAAAQEMELRIAPLSDRGRITVERFRLVLGSRVAKRAWFAIVV